MQYCPSCGRKHEDSVLTCDCGYNLRQRTFTRSQSPENKVYTTHYYAPVNSTDHSPLNKLVGFIRVVGWIFGICSLIYLIYSFVTVPRSFILVIGNFIGGFVIFLLLLSAAAIIELLIDIEKNTRKNE